MDRLLSGIQPTGKLHIGNYLGAIRNWVELQEKHESFFCIVDLHALTTLPNPALLQVHIRETAAAYIAAGINPEKAVIFPQSAISAHSELAWILECFTPLGWLNRMTQFKEKSGKQRELASLGLYAYPVLQAADILIYKATQVPVGEDQKQHLELARDIAGAFNNHYGVEYFALPNPFILKDSARIMSLRDGTSKMSKSDTSDYSRIHLMDDPDTIALKIRKARTDPGSIADTVKAMEDRPEAINLLSIYAGFSGVSLEKACQTYAGSSFSLFKQHLTDQLISIIEPLRQTMLKLLKNPTELDKILQKGAAKANAVAQPHMDEIKDIVGFLRV